MFSFALLQSSVLTAELTLFLYILEVSSFHYADTNQKLESVKRFKERGCDVETLLGEV